MVAYALQILLGRLTKKGRVVDQFSPPALTKFHYNQECPSRINNRVPLFAPTARGRSHLLKVTEDANKDLKIQANVMKGPHASITGATFSFVYFHTF